MQGLFKMNKLFVFCVLYLFCFVYGAHECQRGCKIGEEPKKCYYEIVEQHYSSMGRACHDCKTNPDDCLRKDCIPGDGFPVPMISLNRQLPGPPIQVCEGDEIIFDLINMLDSDSETIHWHGLHHRHSQFMDGVPFITQCPIHGAFQYRFKTEKSGTYFYHSHSGTHRLAGVQGALVIRDPEDFLEQYYDYDLPEHVFLLEDWAHVSADSKLTGRMQHGDDDYPSTILINGRGTNTMAETENVSVVEIPRHTITVESGSKYRVRFINGASMNCPILITIDSHDFTVIATDGSAISPTVVSSLIIYPGERFDIVIDANQDIDNYLVRFNGIIDCEPNKCHQEIQLNYIGAENKEPIGSVDYDPSIPEGIHMNPLNSGPGEGLLTMADVMGLPEQSDNDPALLPTVDKQFVLSMRFAQVNNTMYFGPGYAYNQVSRPLQVKSPQINEISFKFPSKPPLMVGMTDTEQEYCKYGEVPQCVGDFCNCVFLLEVGYGETVEMILIDDGDVGDENHPFHIHGYNFHVVAMDRLGSQTNAEEVMALDAAGKIKRKLKNTIQKDDVTIPDGGYTIIRFTANNPGYWLMHCHIMFHSEVGMAALLKVGEDKDMPTPPEGFPTCGNYVPPI